MLGTLRPLVTDAVAHGFGRVEFTVSDLARPVTAECLGGEGQRFCGLVGPDLGVVGMEGGFEPEEAPPSEEESSPTLLTSASSDAAVFPRPAPPPKHDRRTQG
jgi:hypothetical protein